MVYMGSKARLAKYIAPIIQSYITPDTVGYLEPFVGGANMIQHIKHERRFGSDINKYLIALLKHVQDLDNQLPETISEEEYNKVKNNKDSYPDWYVGLIGFTASFGCKFFRGYARRNNGSDPVKSHIKNLKQQRPYLTGISLKNIPFTDIKPINNFVIYCDPPYLGTEAYANKIFNHDYFWDWVRIYSKNNTVLVSEFTAPNDFICLWEKQVKTTLNNGEVLGSKILTERLYKWKE